MIKKILYNWSNIAISIIAVFILYPYFTKTLGEDQYGVWLLITSITGYFSIFQIGVPLANVRFVSKYYAINDFKKINEVLSSNIIFFSVLSFVVLIASLFLGYYVEYFFKIPTKYLTVTRLAVVFATFEICIKFIFEVFEGVVHALQKFGALNIIKNFITLLKLILMYSVVQNENGIYLICSVVIVVALLQGIAFLFVSKRILPMMNISTKNFSKKTFIEVTSYSVFVLILQFASRISFQTDSIVIGSFISVGSIIYFSIASNILTYLMQFVVGISQTIMPKMSALDALNDYSALGKAYITYSRLTFTLIFPVCISIYLFGGDFIGLWMGTKYVSDASNVLNILTLSYLFFLVQRGIAFPIMMGISKMKFLSILMLTTAVLNLLLSIIWGRQFGLVGVAWGTTIPNIINVIAIVYYMTKLLKINVIKYTVTTYILPCYLGLAFLLPVLLFKNYVKIDSYLMLVTPNAIGFILYYGLFKLTSPKKLHVS